MTASLPRPRKRLGQHFLIDPNIVRKILAQAELRREEPVLEIGPGRGILTRALCESVDRLIAIELDRALHTHLQEVLGGYDNLDLRLGDALAFPYDTLPQGTVVVANLPYYISSPVLQRLLSAGPRISRMIIMLQTEVARRLVAKPGTKEYGTLSVLTQYRAVPSVAFTVAPGCFRPKPQVGSAVVSLIVRASGAAAVHDEGLFVRTVRSAFAHRRKTLANSLRHEGYPPELVAGACERTGIAPSCRAETLGLMQFTALANELSARLEAAGISSSMPTS